ncbi:glycosyltransferase family 4 protein [Candidatus Bathyarchaeota archaeon]|nr:glycosyltransferase family 4 protein [Candidatus Bathyarchaeota archaeon]
MTVQKQTIFMISPSYYPAKGGLEKHVEELAQYLSNNGCKVIILSSVFGEKYFKPVENVSDNLIIYRFSVRSMNKFIAPIATLLYYMKMLKYCYRIASKYSNEITIVHGHGVIPGIVAIKLSDYISRPVVVTFHGSPTYTTAGFKVFPQLFFRRLSRADVIVSTSAYVKLIVQNLGLKDVIIIPNWIDDGLIARRRVTKSGACNPKQSEFTMGYIGRLSPRKNVHLLLYALKKLKRKYKVGLVIAGSGSEMPHLRKLALKLNVNNNVSFLGWVNNVIRVLDAIDVLVLPSKGEGFPFVVLEAFARGVPVVAYKAGEPCYLLRRYHCGIVLDKLNTDTIASSISSLIDNKNLLLHYSKNAQYISKYYSKSQLLPAYLRLYNRLFPRKDKSVSMLINYGKEN